MISTKINEQQNIADITLISDILPSEKIDSHFNIAIYVKWIRNGNWWKFSKKSFLRASILDCPPTIGTPRLTI